jgi:hypothetical protein
MKAAGHCLVFDAGPHGFGRAGHGHADALAIELSIHGERVLVDPGTCQYGDPPWRDAFRLATAHNTVIVDGAEPATPAGAFGWARRVEGRLTRWTHGAQFDWAEGRHEGYQTLGDPVSVRRKLLFCKPAYWVLQNILEGREEHTVDLLFHLALGGSATLMPSGEVHVRTAGARSLWLVPLGQEGIHVDVTTGQLFPPQGWVSPRYGERIAAPVVRFRCRVHAPAALCTLLCPDASPTVQRLPAHRAGRCLAAAVAGGAIVSTAGFRDLLLFRHDAGGPIEVNGWETDAEAVVIREAPDTETTTWQVGGSYVRKAVASSQ